MFIQRKNQSDRNQRHAGRAAGANAVGFSLVAHELQIFSEKMTVAMQALSTLIYRQVVLTARKRHCSHSVVLPARADSYGDLAQTHIVPACARSQADMLEMERLIADHAA